MQRHKLLCYKSVLLQVNHFFVFPPVYEHLFLIVWFQTQYYFIFHNYSSPLFNALYINTV